jgi:endoglucanase
MDIDHFVQHVTGNDQVLVDENNEQTTLEAIMDQLKAIEYDGTQYSAKLDALAQANNVPGPTATGQGQPDAPTSGSDQLTAPPQPVSTATVPPPTSAPVANVSVRTLNGLYVPNTQLTTYLEENPTDPNYAVLEKVEAQPKFVWLNGDVVNDPITVKNIMENCGDSVPMFSLYAIPDRDNGGPSGGGLADEATYNAYVGDIGYQIQQAGNKPCLVVVETDALGVINTVATTYPCINAAVDILKKNSNTKVFLGDSSWVETSDMAGRLIGAGVERADGIAENVAGYDSNENCATRAEAVLALIPTKTLTFLTDTSRNGGVTKPGDWENPDGAKIGQNPELVSSGQLLGYFWVKNPSESDGPVTDDPKYSQAPGAGTLWVARTVELAD